jgi:predicted  nucleic acid-binding Zn-ribbon protein
MGAVRFSIDPGLVRELTRELPLKVFVETGTYEGASVRAALPMFDQLHTVELAPPLYARAAEEFGDQAKVHVHHGRSEEVLRELVPKLRRRAVLYWLDAHWCDEKSAGGDAQCPLLGELEAIRSISDRSVVLIDDARLFMAPPPKPAVTEGWPRFSEVLDRLQALNPKHELLVIDDVIVFFPPTVREPLSAYAHDHAVDWLNEIQVSNRVGNRLERMREEFAKVRAQNADQARKQAERVGRRLTELASTVNSLEQALAAELESTGSRVDAISKALEGFGERSEAALDERLAPLATEVGSTAPQLESVFKALRGLRGRLTQLGKRLENLSETRKDVQELARLVEPLDSRLAALDERVEPLDSRLAALDKRVEPLDSRLAALDKRVEPLDSRLAALDKRVEPVGDQLAALAQALNALQERSAEIQERSAESLTALGELPEARGEIAALAKRVDAMGVELEQLRRIDRSLNVEANRSQATLEQLRGMRKQMRALQDRLEEKERKTRFPRIRGFFLRLRMRLFGPRLGSLDHHPPRDLRVPRRYRRQSAPPQAPPISIVTPAGDHAPFVDRTIRSVLDQEYEPLEYIVEHCGSSKETARVLERHRDRLARCDKPKNGKPAAAMNQGLDAATGDVLSYVRPDSLLLPGALPYVARYFERHPEVDVVYGHRVLVDADDKEVGRWVLPRHRDEILSWADFVPDETLFWRRSIWEAIGGELDEDLGETLDWDLLLRFRDVGAHMARVPRFLGAVRVPGLKQRLTGTGGANGNTEMQELRARVHGRAVSDDEAQREIRGYIRRHVMLQKLYRLHLLRY